MPVYLISDVQSKFDYQTDNLNHSVKSNNYFVTYSDMLISIMNEMYFLELDIMSHTVEND